MVTQALDIQWRERLNEVKCVHKELHERPSSLELIKKLSKFAEDPKWEIRKEVAEAILHVPQDKLYQFTPLCKDQNSYVKNAAKSAMARSGVLLQEDGTPMDGLILASSPKIKKLLDKASSKRGNKSAAQLQAAYRDQYDQALGTMGHEIRNRISPTLNAVGKAMKELSQMAISEAAKQKIMKELQVIKREADAMEVMTNDIRALVKPTQEKKSQETLLFMINEALNVAKDAFRNQEDSISGIKVTVNITPEVTCYVARNAIMHAFTNLLKNAYESFQTDEDTFASSGKIVIEAATVPGGVQITIADTGMGMSKEELELVCQFTPKGTSKKASGTGFGLPIACRKIQDHQGTINIASEEDKGTTVTIFLPDQGAN